MEETELVLTPDQEAAVKLIEKSRVAVVTGPPGSGKTTILKAALQRLRMDEHVALCAPTGKAAKRMSEVTAYGAMTVHRLLGAKYSSAGWSMEYDEYNRLPQ